MLKLEKKGERMKECKNKYSPFITLQEETKFQNQIIVSFVKRNVYLTKNEVWILLKVKMKRTFFGYRNLDESSSSTKVHNQCQSVRKYTGPSHEHCNSNV